ncbi:hypothetical protein LJC68_02490 [Bacteroidales bacterium OttesenSCG-928-B11]|nr:hypothetical protein [Bacteroidales bacterium OttesenSCG-928-C03]MDL2311730.1 hypothetical protein [Bacteroidales bacterium OttesenSCG-928-B11]MDL2325924.1 hypothetical protein [Bacteroidales bacterium OttesenSCG-928-A14]
MKKLSLLLVSALFVFAFTSCDKSVNCSCEETIRYVDPANPSVDYSYLNKDASYTKTAEEGDCGIFNESIPQNNYAALDGKKTITCSEIAE